MRIKKYFLGLFNQPEEVGIKPGGLPLLLRSWFAFKNIIDWCPYFGFSPANSLPEVLAWAVITSKMAPDADRE
ncbi:hypothetical protein [Adhaeribacter aerolatus]|uniref:hypothetical protein n=1 Tax=Adhaeribacter aerolatus TaxID=670289 RepID=UPI0011BD89F6|nr:hypothetical protein [Adhaeribacter aerolatus]